MPKPIPVTAAEAVNRALTAAKGPAVRYALGAGGVDPHSSTPAPAAKLDCSGFVSWTMGLPREYSEAYGGWIETLRIFRDAMSAGTKNLFDHVTIPKAGDLVVYGDTGEHQGHVGLITKVTEGRVARVAHCCARVGLRSAIVDEPYSVFWQGAVANRGAIFARPRFYVAEKLKHIEIHLDGKVLNGELDAAAGVAYYTGDGGRRKLRDVWPRASFGWNREMTEVEVTLV